MKKIISDRVTAIRKHINIEGYKKTHIGILPNEWEVISINECSRDIFLGLTSRVDYVEDGGFPLVRAKDISSGKLNFLDVKFISEEQHKQLTKFRKAEKGDILVSKSGTLGTCCLVDTDIEFSIYESIIAIKTDDKKLIGDYLLQLFRDESVQYRMLGARVGGTVGHLNLKHFRELVLPIPPLQEQHKISTILSTWDKAIELKEKLIEEKKKQKKGLMQKLLTGEVRLPGFNGEWKEVKLDKIVFYQEGPGVRKYQYRTKGVKLLNVGNLRNNQLDLSSTDRYISKDEAYGAYSHFMVDEGDLLIACSGITADSFDDKIAFAEHKHLPLCMNTSTMRFKSRDEKELNIRYLFYYLQSYNFKSQISGILTGSAQFNFGPTHLKFLIVKVPSISEQEQITKYLDCSLKEIDLLQKEHEALKLQKKGLMQLLLTGIVRVNTEN